MTDDDRKRLENDRKRIRPGAWVRLGGPVVGRIANIVRTETGLRVTLESSPTPPTTDVASEIPLV